MVSDCSTNMIFPLNMVRVRSFPENVASSGVHTAKTVLENCLRKGLASLESQLENGRQFRTLCLSRQRSRCILAMVCKHCCGGEVPERRSFLSLLDKNQGNSSD